MYVCVVGRYARHLGHTGLRYGDEVDCVWCGWQMADGRYAARGSGGVGG